MSAPTTKLLQSRHWLIALAVVQAVVCILILQSRFWDSGACAPALLESLAPGSIELEDPTPSDVPKLEVALPLLVTEKPTASFRGMWFQLVLVLSETYIEHRQLANGHAVYDILAHERVVISSHPILMSQMNLLYLARLTERVPILPQFRPVPLAGNTSGIDFSDVFDMARLRKDLKTPILEWREVKELENENVEDLGCWDIQYKTWEADNAALEPPVELNLDVSCTPIPQWVRSSIQMDQADRSMYLWPLASLVAFNKRAASSRALPAPVLSPLHRKVLAPDDQLFCCNSLYFDFTVQLLEEGRTSRLRGRASGGICIGRPSCRVSRRIIRARRLGSRQRSYIAVHIRRGDFAKKCKLDGVAQDDCLAPLSAYERRVKEVDPAWWEPVHNLGWLRPNHNETIALYGPWYPVFIDAVIHSAAYGFVGTDTSTASILARRRVSSRGGVADMVKWGNPKQMTIERLDRCG
ncbi:hypothetical protein C8R45DRAFT_1110247 [Mycena sanguinolenta]|nr:hypothetical protein C8R45DRAFT_1110246 [Mycena sanguinolenta]KAJ6457905.1 hypothetical protein C8R45DRAFT_1110247 [Mycena sanguinolenta]